MSVQTNLQLIAGPKSLLYLCFRCFCNHWHRVKI